MEITYKKIIKLDNEKKVNRIFFLIIEEEMGQMIEI